MLYWRYRYLIGLIGSIGARGYGPARIRMALRERHADGMLMAALDDIAWTLNLRGSDVHCNPVFVSYLLIAPNDVTLYINKVKLSPEVLAYLKAEGVGVAPYEEVRQGLKDYFAYNILLDPDEVNYALYEVVRSFLTVPSTSNLFVL